eukprot:6533470-Karenia_brevis.AAC.1
MQLWHEKTVAKDLAIIRTDRPESNWQTIKDIDWRKRKRENFYVHARTGAHMNYDHLFCRVWG